MKFFNKTSSKGANSRIIWLSLLVFCALAFFFSSRLIASHNPDDPHGQPFVIDHFLSYNFKLTTDFKPYKVILHDQFGPGIYRVDEPKRLLNPTHKLHAGIQTDIKHPDAHLIAYKIKKLNKQKPHKLLVGTHNQFGFLKFKVGKADLLLVPAIKHHADDPIDPTIPPTFDSLNHFLCYQIKLTSSQQFPGAKVVLRDQFGAHDEVDVIKPVRLCNPAAKLRTTINADGTVQDVIEDIKHPKDHLVCYQIRVHQAGTIHTHPAVQTLDQFNYLRMNVDQEKELCVPSTKRILIKDNLDLLAVPAKRGKP